MSKKNTTLVQLTADEVTKLGILEGQITKGYAAYVTVANAVYQIHTEKLYRIKFRSITDYCFHSFDFSANDTSRYRQAGEVLAELGDLPQLPTSESQCRALARFAKGKRKAAWLDLIESKEKLTAKLIGEAADEVVEKNPISEKTSKLKKLAHMIETVKELSESTLDVEVLKKLRELIDVAKSVLPSKTKKAEAA